MDKKEALEIVKNDPNEILNLPENFQKDRDVVLESIKNDNGASMLLADLSFRHEIFLKDREIVLEAVKKYGDILIHVDVDKSFLKDKEIVLEALKSSHEWEGRVSEIMDAIDKSLVNDEDIKYWSSIICILNEKDMNKMGSGQYEELTNIKGAIWSRVDE